MSDLSKGLIKSFTEIIKESTDSSSTTLNVYGTVIENDDGKHVIIDGSDQYTPITEMTEAKHGDRVLVTIENHTAVVIGNYTYPPSARTANEALDISQENQEEIKEVNATVAENKAAVIAAQAAADAAQSVAGKALLDAKNAAESADNALADAEAAQKAADNAIASAGEAHTKIDAAQNTVDGILVSIDEMSPLITAAQSSADAAQVSANAAQTSANEAKAANAATQAELETTKTAVATAQSTANAAVSNAQTAQSAANAAQSSADQANTLVAEVQEDANKALEEIDNLGSTIETLENTMTTDYARKTDLSSVESTLQSQITQNAAEIQSTVSKVTTMDTTFSKQAQDALSAANAAQSSADAAQAAADSANEEAINAQNAASQAAQAAANAQTQADTAKTAAATADAKAAQAQNELNTAKANLEAVTSRVDATEDEIAAAQTAVTAAQAAANKAQSDADKANEDAAKAQSTADTAAENAATAQTNASNAVTKAEAAQTVANDAKEQATEAKNEAYLAVSAANDAKDVADAASEIANTAAANAANAQSIANTAAADAATAQSIADAAAAKATTAQNDLNTAKANLEAVTSRVDATEDEVAAAQAAVEAAQAAADAAASDAATAQSTADTAKANAATAQNAADTAKQAADQAQADAEAAQAAADKAQEDVNKLAVTVTEQSTKITQNAEAIQLRATKTEVAQTLSGYYTKEQADAAINVKADSITQTVSNTYQTKADMSNYSTTTQMNSAIQQKADSITSTVAATYTTKDEFNNLSIGGRNLALKTNQNDSGWYFNTSLGKMPREHIEENGMYYTKLTFNYDASMAWWYIYYDHTMLNLKALKPNTQYTVSFDVKASISTRFNVTIMVGDTTNPLTSGANTAPYTTPDEWTTVSCVITTFDTLNFNGQCLYLQASNNESPTYCFRNLKIEEGNKPTAWTPAPEDCPTTTQMNSAIQQKADSITQTVAATYTTKNDFNNLSIDNTNLFRYSKPYLLDSSGVSGKYNVGRGILKRDTLWVLSGEDECYSFTLNSGQSNAYCELKNTYREMAVTEGQTYWLSFDYAFSEYCTGINIHIYQGNTWITNVFGRTRTTSDSNIIKRHGEISWTATFTGTVYLTIYNAGTLDTTKESILYFTNIKFEKGTKATAWTPNPNDVRGSVDEVSNNLANNYSTTTQMNSAIQQKADSITSTVAATYTTKNEFNNLSIGGRNLLRNSAFLDGTTYWTCPNNQNTTTTVDNNMVFNGHPSLKISSSGWTELKWYGAQNWQVPKGNTNIKAGETITVSCWYYVADKSKFDNSLSIELKGTKADNSGGTIVHRSVNPEDIVENEWTRIYRTINVPDDYNNIYCFIYLTKNGEVWFADIKVEKGDKVTDWTPAPEDVAGDIKDVADNLANNYSTTTQMNSAIQQKADSITQTVAATYTTKNDFNNLSIGGTNLLAKGRMENSSPDVITAYFDETSNTWTMTHLLSANMYQGLLPKYGAIRVPYGKTLCVSWEMKVPRSCSVMYDINNAPVEGNAWNGNDNDVNRQGNQGYFTIPQDVAGQWVKYYFTYTNAHPNNTNKVDLFDRSKLGIDMANETEPITYQIRNYKFEYGNRPTDYSPCPDDYSTTTQMNSAIQQKADSITLTVAETYTTKDEFNDLSIGGRNIIQNSSPSSLDKWALSSATNWSRVLVDCSQSPSGKAMRVTSNTTSTTTGGVFYPVNADLIDDETEYTMSLYIRASKDMKIMIKNELIYASSINTVSTEWKLYSFTGIIDKTRPNKACVVYFTGSATQGDWYEFHSVKFEKGNKATAWSPAPEDYSTTKEMNTAIQQKADSITSTVAATYTTKNEFDNLQIGGRNLALGTSNEYSTPFTNFDGTSNRTASVAKVLIDGLAVGDEVTVRIIYKYDNIVSTDGNVAKMTLQGSGDVTGWSSGSFYGSYTPYGGYIPIEGSGEIEILYTFTATANHVSNNYWNVAFRHDYVASGSVQWKLFKVEKGNKATDWSPAHEDMVSTTQMSSALEQTATSINAKFKDTGGYNMIRNSSGLCDDGIPGWSTTSNLTCLPVRTNADALTHFQSGSCFTIHTSQSTEGYIFSDRIKLKPNTTYNISGRYATDAGSKGLDVFVLTSDTLPITDVSTAYDTVAVNFNVNSAAQWWKSFSVKFTTGASVKSGFVRIDHNGKLESSTASTSYNWIGDLLLVEGSMVTKWSPHPEEVYTGITTIDKNGIKVTHKDITGHTRMQADGFYVNNGTEDVISMTNGNLNVKGAITVTGGSVPTNYLSGQITGTQITDNAVTSAKIAANAITADKIAANAITADKIASKSITTDKMVIGSRTNYSELNIDTYSRLGFSIVEDSASSNNPWFKLNTLARDTGLTLGGMYKTYDMTEPGTYRVSYEMSSTVKGATSSGGSTIDYLNINVGFYCTKHDGNYVWYVPWGGTSDVNGTVQTVSLYQYIPDGVKTFSVALQLQGWAPFSGECKIRNVRVEKMMDTALIVNGAVTADKISANAVTADKIAANAITADKILANAVTTDKIATRSITADKLTIGDYNNYCQLVKGKHLTVDSAVASWVVDESDSTNTYWKHTGGDYFPLSNRLITNPFNKDDVLTFKFDIYSQTARNISVGVWYYTEAGAYITQDTASITTTVGWKTETVDVTLSKSAAQYAGRISILIRNDGTSYMCIRNVTIRRKVGGELIVNGAVTAGKIAAGAITADKIAANAITAGKIAAGAISAGHISGNTLEGTSIVGGTFRNSDSSFSVTSAGKITGATIIGPTIKNAESNPTFQVSSNGNLKIGGLTGHTVNGYERAQFEVTSNGTVYSVSKDFAGYYCLIGEGQIKLNDAGTGGLTNIYPGEVVTDMVSTKEINSNGDTLELYNGLDGIIRLRESDGNTYFNPGDNGYVRLGSSSYKWASIWCAQSALNTSSDRRTKTDITYYHEDDRFEKMFMDLKPCTFQKTDSEFGRHHSGFIAQEVEDAMTDNGLDYTDFGALLKIPVDEQGEELNINDEAQMKRQVDYEYGLRYGEFTALNTHMIQKLFKHIDKLEARIAELESKLGETE